MNMNMNWPFLSIRRALALVTVVLLVPAIWMLWIDTENSIESIHERNAKNMHAAVDMAAVEYSQALNGTHLFLNTLSRSAEIRHASVLSQRNCNGFLKTLLRDNSQFANIAYTGRDGGILCSGAFIKADQTISLVDRPYFQAALKTGSFTVSDILKDRVTGKLAVNVAYPVYHPKTGIHGVLVATIDLTWLGGIYSGSRYKQYSVVTVFDQNGRILVRQPEHADLRLVGVRLADWPLVILAQKKDPTVVLRLHDIDGEEKLFVVRKLSRNFGAEEQFIAIGMSLKGTNAQLLATRTSGVILILITFCFVLLVVVGGGAAFFTRPVELILGVMENFGGGNTAIRSGVSPNQTSEFGRIANAFDQMADRVQQLVRRNHLLLLGMRDAVLGMDTKGNAIFSNPAATMLLGYTAEEFRQISLEKVLYQQDDASHHLRPMDAPSSHSKGGSWLDEIRLTRKNGEHFFAEMSVTPLREENEVEGVVVVIRDISEKIRAQEQLHILGQAIEQSPIMIAIVSKDGLIDYCNTVYCEKTGYGMDEILDRPPHFLDAVVESAWRECVLGIAIPADDSRRFEKIVSRKSGEEFWCSVHVYPVRLKHGNADGYVIAGVDISERKLSEKRLRDNESKLNGILGEIKDGIWSASLDLRDVYYCNAALERILGLTAQDITANPGIWKTVVDGEHHQMLIDMFSRVLELGEAEAECRIICSDDRDRWAYTRVKLVTGDDEKQRIDGITTDVTQRKSYEMELAYLANHDQLTGLSNRSVLETRLAQWLHIAERGGASARGHVRGSGQFQNC